MEGVLLAMFMSKVKIAAGMLLAAAMIAAGASVLAYARQPSQPHEKKKAGKDRGPETGEERFGKEIEALLKPTFSRDKVESLLDAANVGERLKALLKARLKAAKAEMEAGVKDFHAGRGTLDALGDPSQRLLKAELELGPKKADLIAALDRHFQLTKKLHEVNEARFDAAKINIMDLSEAKLDRLEAEIELERVKSPGAAKLKDLMKARLKAAETELYGRMKEFEVGKGTLDILFGASQRWLSAKLQLSNKKEDRIAALDAHFERMKEIESVNQQRFEAGRVHIMDLSVAKFYRLDAEIQLQRAKSPAKSEDKLKELMKARLQAAETEADMRMKEFIVGKGTLDILFGASRRLLSAKLDLSDKREDRMAALEAHLQRMKKLEAVNQQRFDDYKVQENPSLVKFYRLDAEIELERAKAK